MNDFPDSIYKAPATVRNLQSFALVIDLTQMMS